MKPNKPQKLPFMCANGQSVVGPILQGCVNGDAFSLFLDTGDLANLSQVNKFFNERIKDKLPLISLVQKLQRLKKRRSEFLPLISNEIIKQLKQASYFNSLYDVLTKTWFEPDILAVWDLYCLSSNEYAVQYAIDNKLFEESSGINPWAMLYTAQSGCVKSMEIIQETFGIEWTAADERGNTVLHYAAASGNKGAVRFLLNNGADLSATNQDGLTALDFVQNKILRAHELRNDAMGSPHEVLAELRAGYYVAQQPRRCTIL